MRYIDKTSFAVHLRAPPVVASPAVASGGQRWPPVRGPGPRGRVSPGLGPESPRIPGSSCFHGLPTWRIIPVFVSD